MKESEQNRNHIFKELNKFKKNFKGRYISEAESIFFIEKLGAKKINKFLIKLMLNFPIVGQLFSLSGKEDKSGLGVEMDWERPKQVVEYTFMSETGKIIHKYGYVIVGFCAMVSADTYCINSMEEELSLVRVPHEHFTNKRCNFSEIEIVSPSLLTFFKKSLNIKE